MTDSLQKTARRGLPAGAALALSVLGNILVITILAVSIALIVVAGAVVFGPALLALA